MVFTSTWHGLLLVPSIVLAMVAALAAIPALAVAFGWVARRLGGAPAVSGSLAVGGLALGLAAAAGFVALAVFANPDERGVLIGALAGLTALAMAAVGGAKLASSASRSALRAVVACGPPSVPWTARTFFGMAAVVGGLSLWAGVHQFAVAMRGAPGELVLALTPEAIPPFLVGGVGRVAAVAGAVGLLRGRYAGTLLCSAGYALAALAGIARSWPSFPQVLLELAVDVPALVLAWTYVGGCEAERRSA